MSFLPHQVPFTLLLYANTEKRQHKIKNETTKSNNTYKIVQIFNYADIYCFFDRMSLGNMLTVFTCPDKKQQDVIFEDLKRFNMNFNVQKIPDFINKIFCLVSIRNCVMHSNSLEILIRFYNPKTHELRKVSDRKKYLNMIKELCKEKTHE